MILPKPLFQKLLDGEISSEQYKNELAPDTQKRFAILTVLNLLTIFFIDQYWTKTGNLKGNFWFEFLTLTAVYLGLAVIFGYLLYRDEKKNVQFLIKVAEEEHENKKKNHDPMEQQKTLVPRTAGKLFMSGKISKCQYVRSVLSFRLAFTRWTFCVFFVIFIILFWIVLEADFLTKLASSYGAAFLSAFLFRLKLGDNFLLGLNQTLIWKQKQHEAFDHAENSLHS